MSELRPASPPPTGPGSRPSTIDAHGRRLWVYPDRRPGPRGSRRKLIAVVLIAIYLMVPWASPGGVPLVRFDVFAQRAFLFGLSFPITDASFVVFLFVALALTLFIATALRGRIWCGYACPQTVFTEWIIRPIEELFEGPAHRRRLRDKEPWSLGRTLRKVGKHTAFVAVAIVVANTFLAYFVAPERLYDWVTAPPSEHPTAFGLMSFALLAFYADLGWFREQFCCFLCPYARFQSILLDRRSPVVTYGSGRGEPRGRGKDKGDCIDCGLCTRVCPTGIDIRKGLQLECIACERCIDACDSVMTTLKRPRGLIDLAPLDASAEAVSAWRRPRVLIYLAVLAVALALATYRLEERAPLKVTVLRAPGSTYSVVDGGAVGNLFNLRFVNNDADPKSLGITVVEPAGGRVACGVCATSLKSLGEAQGTLALFLQPPLPSRAILRVEATGELIEVPLLGPKQ